jgi:hypothetical protein
VLGKGDQERVPPLVTGGPGSLIEQSQPVHRRFPRELLEELGDVTPPCGVVRGDELG